MMKQMGRLPQVAPEDFVQLSHTRQWNLAAQQIPQQQQQQQQQQQLQSKKPAPVKKIKTPIVPVTVGGVPIAVAPVAVAGSPGQTIEDELTTQNLYKTELCRSYEETGICRYGNKCQFAHGQTELRPVMRHPKYKTEVCKTFHTIGTCPYGKRCRFIHIAPGMPLPSSLSFAEPIDVVPQQQQLQQLQQQPQQQQLPQQLNKAQEWSTSWSQGTKVAMTHQLPIAKPQLAPKILPTQLPILPAQLQPSTYSAPETQNIVSNSTFMVGPAAVAPKFSSPAIIPKLPQETVSTPSSAEQQNTQDEEEEGLSRRLSIFAKICAN